MKPGGSMSSLPELQPMRERLDRAICRYSPIDRDQHLDLVLLTVARSKAITAVQRGASVAQALGVVWESHP